MFLKKRIYITAAIFGVLSITLGAFGAHSLKEVLTESQLSSFETGVKYQMYHAILLLILTIIKDISQKQKKRIYYLITVGVCLFSGSIYVLTTKSLTGLSIDALVFITPFGGSLLIFGWIMLLISFFKLKDVNE